MITCYLRYKVNQERLADFEAYGAMWLELVPPSRCQIVVYNPDQTSPLPWVGMNTTQGEFVPWLCSQTDFLATDWEIVT